MRARCRPSRTLLRGSPHRPRSTSGRGRRCRSPRSARRCGPDRATGGSTPTAGPARVRSSRATAAAIVSGAGIQPSSIAVVLRQHEEVESVRVGPAASARARRCRCRAVDAGPNVGRPEVLTHREQRHANSPLVRVEGSGERAPGEVRTDLGAERGDLVAQFGRRSGSRSAVASGSRPSPRAG